MDFYEIQLRRQKDKESQETITTIAPDWIVRHSSDLMVKGGYFYAVWNEETGLWCDNEFEIVDIIDNEMDQKAKELISEGRKVKVLSLRSYGTKTWMNWRSYLRNTPDTNVTLDSKLTFADTVTKRRDYVSKRLPYSMNGEDCPAFKEIMSTLYSDEEARKILWAIGSIFAGDSPKIQKFLVLYGPAGSGKSTVLNIIQKLFDGYFAMFEAKALTSTNDSFSTEVFKSNPLVAIQHDGDLSKIEDNSRLNSIVSHEIITINEKYHAIYQERINAFLFMGTNKPVKITDSMSGLIRRLIDVQPSGQKIEVERYFNLMDMVDFELGAIAKYCLDVYQSMGINFYNNYRPTAMMYRTDVFLNYILWGYDVFKEQNGVSLAQAYTMYKEYCTDSMIDRIMPRYQFRDALMEYFDEYEERARFEGERLRSWYSGFRSWKLGYEAQPEITKPGWVSLDKTESSLDLVLSDCKAQYATDTGIPKQAWRSVKTTLSELDTSKLHYVQQPENMVIVDLDLKNSRGEKDPELNYEAANKFPATYAEASQGSGGIHLHYWYTGDVSKLLPVYADGIEIKVRTGDSALRRRVSRCNNFDILTISSGLPEREEPKTISDSVKSEKALRLLIARNLKKEIHPGTKPSIDFIFKILEEAYESDLSYNVEDMRSAIITFASGSTNQALYCLGKVKQMKFKSEDSKPMSSIDDRLVFFDCEVFRNLFIVCWKYEGSDQVVKMINPTSGEIEQLMQYRLIGFNNRKYDNHILYGRYLGRSNLELFDLSQRIINDHGGFFMEAYNMSYLDVYEVATIKQSLKKWELQLHIPHVEYEGDWNDPVPEADWQKVADYCANDVRATEEVFNHIQDDFEARKILAAISGLSVNHSTQNHAARIIFGDDKSARSKFVYTDLSTEFPGYRFSMGKSSYRDEDPGEGGYVYAEPGYYENVALLDIASMHPASIEALQLFGPYTKRYTDLRLARIAVKHGDFDAAGKYFNGALKPYLTEDTNVKALSYALKIALNIVYGMTSAKFENPFMDVRNTDNIVAKRGALFMIDLKHAIQEQGYTVAHIKTDSVKIPNADDYIIKFVTDFGKKYGYDFEHEATYNKFCLVNDAVYIARDLDGYWTATGLQFQVPYVFKTLFSGEPLEFDDYTVDKTVTTTMYLDFEEDKGKVFVGKAGRFCPVTTGGGTLYRLKDEKYYAVGGTTGYKWLEASVVQENHKEDTIDMTYFEKQCIEAKKAIGLYIRYADFIK